MSIYLDYAADTPPDPQVLAVYAQTAARCFANPNAAHPAGAAAKDAVDSALARMADLLHTPQDTLILTSGASEANNLAVKGIAHAARRRGKHIISTYLEHSSVSGALTFLQEMGWEIDLVQIGADGKADLDRLRRLLREDTVLCAVCAVDSELGTVQPVREIASLLADHPNCRLHVDATQAIGKLPFDVTCADTVSFAPHKFYGLKGCGVLVKRAETVLEPLIHGGASTTVYRSGTPDPAAAAACAEALSAAIADCGARSAAVTERAEYLRSALQARFGSALEIYSPADAVPHILNLSLCGIRGEEMRTRLAARGVCVSVKSACAVPHTPSRAVYAVTHNRKKALSSFRVSLSHLTTAAELAQFCDILEETVSC